MKINNKKIIVSTLALAMGAALAGSISGSVAWYQYSTRAAAHIHGTAIGTTGDLAVSINNGGTYLHKAEDTSAEFLPMSASGTTAGALTYYKHPVYQYPSLPSFSPAAGDGYYTEYKLKFKFLESDTTNADATADEGTPVTDKEVYLSHFEIVNSGDDIAKAVRMEIIGSEGNKFFVSMDGGSFNTKGKLDLNNNTKLDTDLWDCTDASGTQIEYQNDGSASYTTVEPADVALTAAEMADAYNISAADKVLCMTDASSVLTIKIWLEGWAEVDGSTLWDADSVIGQTFDINMQFTCEANK